MMGCPLPSSPQEAVALIWEMFVEPKSKTDGSENLALKESFNEDRATIAPELALGVLNYMDMPTIEGKTSVAYIARKLKCTLSEAYEIYRLAGGEVEPQHSNYYQT